MIVVPEVHGHVVAVYSGTSFIMRMAQVAVNVTVVQSGSVEVVCQMSGEKVLEVTSASFTYLS